MVALPHSGNWDLAGAWACRTGFPVTTVAERLGDAEFAAFTEFRTALGMEVWAYGDPGTVDGLVDAVRRGRVVCLLSDRDFGHDGVPVDFAGRPVTMPVGPALVAQRSGAALFPTVSQFTDDGMVLRIGPEIRVGPGPDGLVAATRQLADVFAERIADRPRGLAPVAAVLRGRPPRATNGPADEDRLMRVGIVCPYSFEAPGGVQNHVVGLARQLVRMGHRPHILAPGYLARTSVSCSRPPVAVHLRRAGRRRALQRFDREGELRPAERGPGPALVAGRAVRPAAHP